VTAIFASLIQSDFGGDHGNFEAVVRVGNDLWHYFRDNQHRFQPWTQTKRVALGTVAGPGAILQSTLASADHGNFEVVVPLFGPAGRTELWHFFRDNANPGGDWTRVQRVTAENDHVVWPASIIQSDFGEPDNFEVVIPLLGVNGHAELWHFFHNNSGPPSPWIRAGRITAAADVVVGPGSIIQGSRGPHRNNFEVVVPILAPDGRSELWRYSKDNSNVGNDWVKTDRVTGPTDTVATGGGGVILESDFLDSSGRGNFEVVVPLARPHGHMEMWHFFQTTDPGARWRLGEMITASAGVGASFVTSDYGVAEHHHRNFEVLVEECTQSVVHYFRHNDNVANPWLRTVPAGLPAEPRPVHLPGTRKICQLTGEFDLEGWTKAVPGDITGQAPALASHGGRLFLAWAGVGNNQLNMMFSEDNGATFLGKRTFGELSDGAPVLASHNGRLLLAWKGSGNDKLNVARVTLFANTAGRFGIEGLEAKVVLADASDQAPALASHRGRLFIAWTGVGNNRLNMMFSDDGTTFRGKRTFADLSDRGPALTSHNGRLMIAWKGSGNEKLNVATVTLFANTAGGFGIEGLERKVVLGELTEQAPALASHRGRLFLTWKGVGVRNFNLNLLFSEDDGATFRGKPRVPDATDQASALASHGEPPNDCLFWAWKSPHSLPPPATTLLPGDAQLNVARITAPALTAGRTVFAHNRTESRSGIRGTDLGTAFVHNSPALPGQERICFLFGDTWRVNQSEEQTNFDLIAFSTDRNPDDGLDLTFNSQPPVIQGGSVKQGEFEVPLDGVSFRGRMFVFFTDDHFKVAHHNLVRRSIVASSADDGRTFVFLREYSRDKFLNVSVDQADGNQVGLETFGQTLLMWGSGRYRSSDVYLAAMPLEEIASGRFVRFFAGTENGRPVWVPEEARAVPLFCSGSVGELSVRRIPVLDRWLVLYRTDNPGGILLRSAQRPWGPWTDPVLVIHNDDGLGKFFHMGWDHPGNPHDFMHDGIITEEGDPSRMNQWGDAYAPGLIAPLTRRNPDNSTDIYFTMSTWNPYQVVFMTVRLRADGPELAQPAPTGRLGTQALVVPRLEIHGTTPF
jgi:hypothetical protein